MLVLDGDERPTAEIALEHPYFDDLKDPDDFPEPTPYDDSHDNATLSLDEWKRMCKRKKTIRIEHALIWHNKQILVEVVVDRPMRCTDFFFPLFLYEEDIKAG